ncbi:MAG TPA: hypothetical protein VI386_13780 [Candidatus Sulfotelmatobacter sp.]
MWWTTNYWAKWLLGALAYGFLRLIGGLLFPPYFSRPVVRTAFAVWVLYVGLAVALTARYFRRQPRGFERLGLVSFVACVALAMVYSTQQQLWAGLFLLGLAELAERLRRRYAHCHQTC